MSTTSWFMAGLLSGTAMTFGIIALWRTSREAVHGNRTLLFAGGLVGIACAAIAVTLSISVGLSAPIPNASAAPAAPGAAVAQLRPPPMMPMTTGLPPASMMEEMLSIGRKMGVKTAEPMDEAAAQLAARLKARGGTAADWNLLAQAYDFLGRTRAAARARAQAAEITAGRLAATSLKN